MNFTTAILIFIILCIIGFLFIEYFYPVIYKFFHQPKHHYVQVSEGVGIKEG